MNRFRSPQRITAAAWLVGALVWGNVVQAETDTISQPLVTDGPTVEPELQEELGLVRLDTSGGICSAALLNNWWAITAAHCVKNKQPQQLTLISDWKTYKHVAQVRKVVDFSSSGHDVALLQVGTHDFEGARSRDRPLALPSYTQSTMNYVHEFGCGIYKLATETSPALKDNQFRYGLAISGDFDPTATEYEVYGYNGAVTTAGGDSGGPSFLARRDDPALPNPKIIYSLLGVHSACLKQCPADKSCEGWDWVTAIDYCFDASILPIRDAIATAITETPVDVSPGFELGTPITSLVFNAIQQNGDLLWYRANHDDATNETTWLGPKLIAQGWDQYTDVMGAGYAGMFARNLAGDILWFEEPDFDNGAPVRGPVVVGKGFDAYLRVFAGGNGIFYGVHPSGQLFWFRYSGWEKGTEPDPVQLEGRLIGYGWDGFVKIFSQGEGIIYGIEPNGDLMWYRHKAYYNGNFEWDADGQAIKVSSGWQNFVDVFADGDGVIYAVDHDGVLFRYRHVTWNAPRADSTWEWPVRVGSGWSGMRKVFGYQPSYYNTMIP